MSNLHVSFEFFPPKTKAMHEKLWASVEKLAPLEPEFVSVTYGAGGSTRSRTHETVSRIVREAKLPVAAHLTCVDASRSEVDEVLQNYWQAGVKHIVALRGDPPGGPSDKYAPHPDGYANAAELAAGARKIAPFEVSVGCYPEKHPDSPSVEADIDMLKSKVDAGATRAITQFFYDNEVFLAIPRPRLGSGGPNPDCTRCYADHEFCRRQKNGGHVRNVNSHAAFLIVRKILMKTLQHAS